MRSGCWVRTAARCLLPLPRRLPVGSDTALAQCAPSVAAMVRAALTSNAPNARACKKLMFDYDVLRFGRLGACKRMAANALGKREV